MIFYMVKPLGKLQAVCKWGQFGVMVHIKHQTGQRIGFTVN